MLKLKNISKNFDSNVVVSNVSFEISEGEVVSILGDNGAGKSTLMKCISGIYKIDSGDIQFHSKNISSFSIAERQAVGIAMIYQDLKLFRKQSIVTNIFAGHEISKFGFLRKSQMRKLAENILLDLGVNFSVDSKIESLSGGQLQSLAIARALVNTPKLLIMDEPTAALGLKESSMVLELIKKLSQKKIGILIISHKLNEALAISDRLLIMKKSQLVYETRATETTIGELTQRILN